MRRPALAAFAIALFALMSARLAAPRPAAAEFLGLFPDTVVGMCVSVSPGVVSVADKHNETHVFVLAPGLHMPSAALPGCRLRVEYTKRDDGVLMAKKVKVLPHP